MLWRNYSRRLILLGTAFARGSFSWGSTTITHLILLVCTIRTHWSLLLSLTSLRRWMINPNHIITSSKIIKNCLFRRCSWSHAVLFWSFISSSSSLTHYVWLRTRIPSSSCLVSPWLYTWISMRRPGHTLALLLLNYWTSVKTLSGVASSLSLYFCYWFAHLNRALIVANV